MKKIEIWVKPPFSVTIILPIIKYFSLILSSLNYSYINAMYILWWLSCLLLCAVRRADSVSLVPWPLPEIIIQLKKKLSQWVEKYVYKIFFASINNVATMAIAQSSDCWLVRTLILYYTRVYLISLNGCLKPTGIGV